MAGLLGLLTLSVVAAAPSAPAAQVVDVGGPTYYVDSTTGNDANPGTSSATPWRTLEMIEAVPLAPGSSVLLRRGGSWDGSLTMLNSGASGAPIVIASYGRGELPRIHTEGCLNLLGSHIVVQSVHVDSCRWSGIAVSGHDNVVRDSVATGNVAGVYIRPGATRSLILANELRDNNRMSVVTASPTGDDSGAWGVLLRGDDSEVAYNVITGSDAFSYDWGRDGAAIEVYGGRGNRVHHNRALENNMFSELGDARSANNVFSYNVVVSQLERGGFLTTRGANSRYGPVTGTELYNNSVLLKGALSEGIVCHAGCGPGILRMRNNVIQAVQKAGFADAPFEDGNGIYYGGRIQFVLGPGSTVAPPQFVDPATGDLRLRSSSPGIDRGDPSVPHYGVDFDGNPVPADGTGDGVPVIDVGAYELS
ncbi:MAG: right-handed parallel beta-helix repeat-containing protein [Acidobacteria bacterium]|nr:right-handed parallel beta-helix repeat-containing protein [Acidobacteriota bacterium]